MIDWLIGWERGICERKGGGKVWNAILLQRCDIVKCWGVHREGGGEREREERRGLLVCRFPFWRERSR